MIRTILIDDEPLACARLRSELSVYADVEVLAEAYNGFEGLKAIQKHSPDLVFLDVQMPKLDGFELLELLGDEAPSVIFCTAFDQYALDAFKVNAIDYLLKPFDKESLKKAIAKYREKPKNKAEKVEALATPISSQKNRLAIKDGSNIHLIDFKKISHISADGDYVHVHRIGEKNLMKKSSLKAMAERLNTNFIQVHRSNIVNIDCIKAVHPYQKASYILELISGEQLAVSKSGYENIKSYLR